MTEYSVRNYTISANSEFFYIEQIHSPDVASDIHAPAT